MAYKRIFPEEHFHFTTFLRLFSSSVFSDAWHFLRQKGAGQVANQPLNQQLRSIVWFRWMQFLGTYHGYRQSGPLTWQLRQVFYYPQGFVSQQGGLSAGRSVTPIHYHDQEKL